VSTTVNNTVRVACCQFDVRLGDPQANIARIVTQLESAKASNVDIAVFPEASVTGYCVGSTDDALAIGVSLSDLEPIREACERLDILSVVGFAETDGKIVWNTAVLYEPGVEPRTYRKTHLPFLGLDRFVEAGDSLDVFDTRLGKIGIIICFDLRLPEPARTLVLKGAELIVLPTNWPEGAEVSANHIAITRAAESRVFLATCDRVGVENGFRFIGLSKIIGPDGTVLVAAGDEEEIIFADVDLSEARQKRRVVIPGEYETDAVGSRRPALYEGLAW
jgi:predicted amidohydrolase